MNNISYDRHFIFIIIIESDVCISTGPMVMMIVFYNFQVFHVQFALADLPLEMRAIVAEMEADQEGHQG